jgi:sugar/nucleoside kinase (ribokinase family)
LALKLSKNLSTRGFMVTAGRRGSYYATEDGKMVETPALSGRVIDRVGAGDAFFAVTAPCVYKNPDPEIIGFIGNCAGAMAVEIVGNREPINPIDLRKFITRLMK